MALPIPIRNTKTGARGGIPTNPSGGTIQDVGAVTPSVINVPEVREEELKAWLDSLYDTSKITEDEIRSMWEQFSYKGFNRHDVLKQLFVKIKDHQICMELVVSSALRGPQAASRIKLSNGRTPIDLGIPASGGQGTKILTMNKIQAATADLAAYFLKRMNVPKRINVDLPGWLQFPSAGGISLPSQFREAHREFSRRFSTTIGGTFQEQIYQQMENNSYLNPKLKLFE